MEHHVEAHGVDTAYWEYHSDQIETLVCVHGFRGTHHGLLKIVEQLPQYRIIIPDLPGFGASKILPEGHTLDEYVAWLAAFVAAIDQPHATLVAHSFGTIIASHLAARQPQVVKKLILINPIGAPALEGEQRFLTQLAILYYWLGRKLPDTAARAWISMKPLTKAMSVAMRTSRDRSIRRYIDVQHYRYFSRFANPTQLAEAFHTSISADVRQVAEQLHTPTLLVVGEKDSITPLARQEALHNKLPHATIVVIPTVGHLTHYETPREVAAAITDFLT